MRRLPKVVRRPPRIAIIAACLVVSIGVAASIAWGLHSSGSSDASTQTIIKLTSEPGDYVGAGGIYVYTPANAHIKMIADKGLLTIVVDGEEQWNGEFQVPGSPRQLQKGTYADLQRWPFQGRGKGGLSWAGEGRGENTLTGWFAIDSVSYKGGTLAAIALRFEQHGEGRVPALRGEIHWSEESSHRSGSPIPAAATRAPQADAPS